MKWISQQTSNLLFQVQILAGAQKIMYKKIELLEIPKNVLAILETLHSAGYEAYLVGGCVRNLLMDKKPKDWDITTNATPEQIVGLF